MKLDELRKKSEAELQKLLKEDKDKVRNLRFKLAAGQLKELRMLRAAKREVARILTLLHSPHMPATDKQSSNNSKTK